MSAICDARKKKVGVERFYKPGEDRKSAVWRSDQLGIRWVGIKMRQRKPLLKGAGPPGPGWAAQENEKEIRLWPIE